MKTATSNGDGEGHSSICPTCGAKTVKYPHRLNRGLLAGLRAIHRAGGGPINLNACKMNYNVQCNFQKLRYWGMVLNEDAHGNRRAGLWQITNLGRAFLYREITMPDHVWTYRSNPCEAPEGEPPAKPVWITQIVDWYEQRADYAAGARPAGDRPEPPEQGDLFS